MFLLSVCDNIQTLTDMYVCPTDLSFLHKCVRCKKYCTVRLHLMCHSKHQQGAAETKTSTSKYVGQGGPNFLH